MPVIASKLAPRSDDFKANAAAMRAVVDDLNAKLAQIALGGGEAARAKHTGRGKLLPRDRVQIDRAGHVLAHLFNHQVHHRGQLHAMLAGTAIAPPQLDEFLMPSEAALRAADLQALGWREADLFGR